jgi:hypothetical protein
MVNNIFLLILLFFTILLSVILLLNNMWLKIQYKDAMTRIIQMQINATTTNSFLLDKLNNKGKEESVKTDVQEGFINFLNQSRESAFEYIENVQNTINNVVTDLGPIVEFHDKYGAIFDTDTRNQMQVVSNSFHELKKLIPEEVDLDKA